MSEAPLLAIENLAIALPQGAERPLAVDNISLTLARNEILCIVGESGSGKSMTAHAVMGLLPQPHVRATAGRILYQGEDLLAARPDRLRALRGHKLGMIFQEPMTALHPIMRVEAQITEVIQQHAPLGSTALRDRVTELLLAVGLPDPDRLRSAWPHRLSGGQRQRVMIAMALALGPDILIADEPTTALDVTTQAQILALIRRIQAERRMGVMLITHDFGVVAEVADRVAVMQHGRIVEAGPVAQILRSPQHPYTQSLIAAVPRLLAAPKPPPEDAPVVLQAEQVRKTFRQRSWIPGRGTEVAAVRDVSLALRRGETVGIVGESGSGKSTFARCVVRLLAPDSGAIRLHGTDIVPLGRAALRPHRRRIQMVFQDPYASLNPRRRVGDIIAAGPIAHGTPRAEAQRRADELLALVGLDAAAATRYPHEFSGGQRQRIGLARALAMEPDVLVADEPVSALDVSVQAQVLALLAEVRARLNLSMLFITHDLRVAAQVCDRVAVMYRGEIVELRPTAELFARPEHPYVRELLAAVPGQGWLPAIQG